MNKEQRKIAEAERPMARCGRRSEGGCYGRLNVSHPFGRRIQERWMWFWCCETHHTGSLKNESIGKWIVLNQATEEDLRRSKIYGMLKQEREYLNKKYARQPTNA